MKSPWRVGVDVGGTFTDIVVIDGAGEVRVAKVPSTPSDPSQGVLRAVEEAAHNAEVSVAEFLGGCSHFVHGSTVATNVVVERRGAVVGMLVTRGFRDSLEIRRGIRENAWDHRRAFPPVLVPRYLRLPVGGRIDRSGREIQPLSESDIVSAAAVFKAEVVQSVAICLFNSFLTDAHERAARDILARELPGCSISLSSAIAPIMGEYERSSTAVLNAYIAPLIVSYMKRLAGVLGARGLKTPMLVVQNNGGSLTIDNVEERPVALLLSGPAAGVGALSLFGKALGDGNLISMEIGGTSCDVTLLRDGQANAASEFEIGGYHVGLSTIDIHTIGAGGGTIAGVDRSGLLFVGPRGAGASPGPASYGLGGTEPTVTDAQLVLGRLKPGPIAGGRSLDLTLATNAIRSRIAEPLGLTVEAAAAGILRLLEQQLFHAVQKISAERGLDPRLFTLVAAGGAGPMHGSSIGRMLGSPRIYVPRLAGAFCALGMLNAPIRHELSRVFIGRLDASIWPEVSNVLAQLAEAARSQLAADGFTKRDTTIEREIELRYPGELGTIRIAVPSATDAGSEAVRAEFYKAHRRLYGHADETAAVEIGALRVVGNGHLPTLTLQRREARRASAPSPSSTRQVYFEAASGFVPAAVYAGADLSPGISLAGPAVVDEATTSVVVAPGDLCEVDPLGNFVIRPPEGSRS